MPLLGPSPSPSEWPTDALTHYHDARAEAAECHRILWPSQWPNTSEDALCALEQEFSNGGFHYVGITMGPHFRMHTIREGWVADASVGRRAEAPNPRASHWPQHWRCMRVIAFGSAKDIKSLEILACNRFNSCLTNHAAAAASGTAQPWLFLYTCCNAGPHCGCAQCRRGREVSDGYSSSSDDGGPLAPFAKKARARYSPTTASAASASASASAQQRLRLGLRPQPIVPAPTPVVSAHMPVASASPDILAPLPDSVAFELVGDKLQYLVRFQASGHPVHIKIKSNAPKLYVTSPNDFDVAPRTSMLVAFFVAKRIKPTDLTEHLVAKANTSDKFKVEATCKSICKEFTLAVRWPAMAGF